jgi:hypothetical protein
MTQPDANILEGLSTEETKMFRKRVIEAVLATDMSNHFKVLNSLKIRIDHLDTLEILSESKLNRLVQSTSDDLSQDLINYIVHSADISNPAKNFDIYSNWTNLVVMEFFNQGDLEKKQNLPVSFLCDRDVSDVPRSQIGFIKGIVLPLFNIIVEIIPDLQFYVTKLTTNLEIWKNKLEEST